MTTLHLEGMITGHGTLELELPPGLPPGQARVTIEIGQEPEWTVEDIEKALKVEPMTGAEIVSAGLAGGWKDAGIDDGVRWLEDQRRSRRERRLG